MRRSSRPLARALPSRLSRAERVDEPREDGEHVDPHGVQAYEAMIFHITDAATWAALPAARCAHRLDPRHRSGAKRATSTAAPPSSGPASSIGSTAMRPDLLLLHIDEAALTSPLVVRAVCRRARAVPPRLRPDQPRGRVIRRAIRYEMARPSTTAAPVVPTVRIRVR